MMDGYLGPSLSGLPWEREALRGRGRVERQCPSPRVFEVGRAIRDVLAATRPPNHRSFRTVPACAACLRRRDTFGRRDNVAPGPTGPRLGTVFHRSRGERETPNLAVIGRFRQIAHDNHHYD